MRVPGIAVYPGQPGSVHLTTVDLPEPAADEVVVRVERVGICGTDREIIDAHFGTPPPDSDNLILGHEVLGTVETTGGRVTGLAPGDLVVATVRRPDDCPACRAGQSDFCRDRRYTERGIIGLHGFMTERFVEHEEFLVKVPPSLKALAILLEPLSVVEKALRVATAVQHRLQSWRPETAVVLGAGPIGLLGALLLRSEGIATHVVARRSGPHLAASIVEDAGGVYHATSDAPIAELGRSLPNVDLIFECTGASGPVFDGMSLLGNNGVMVLLSLTDAEQRATIPAGAINRELVLGNKLVVGSVNSHYVDFVAGLDHLTRFENLWPGLTARLITGQLNGFADASLIRDAGRTGGIKTVIEFR